MQTGVTIKQITNDAFHSLKLVCDPAVCNPSTENLNKWMIVVSNINDIAFHHLWTYAVFPIQYHLCRHNTQNPILHSSILLIMLQGLKKILSRIFIGSVDHFIQFNKLLTEIAIEDFETVTLKKLSEDIKFAVVDCLWVLNENLSDDVVREIYNCVKKFHFLHAQSVYICTQLARNESYVNLRIVSLKCILAIIRIHGNEKNKIDSKTKANIAETIASMIPGLISMYYFIVSSSSILHRDLYILSARVFGASVAVVFESHHTVEKDEEYLSKLQSLTRAKNPIISSSTGVQSDNWYQNTAEKLVLPAKSLLSLCNNSQWKVRLEIANVAKLILSNCDDSYLMPVLSTLFEVLIVLSRDSMEEVRQIAQRSLSILLEENTLRREKFFVSFKERLFHLLTSITSALNSVDENVLLSQLTLLNGYLLILSPRRIFKSSVHLENLFLTLTKVIRFDSSTVRAISENEATSSAVCDLFENSCAKRLCWRNTKYLSCETESVVKNICHSIGENVDVESLTLYLLNALENQPNNRKEMIYLINNVILNAKSKKYSSNHAHLCKCILNTYLDSMYWSIPITLISEEENSISSASVHSNIIQICLLVEGIGNISLCLGKEFKPLLLQSLYKMVEKAGCANEIISSTAINSLRYIAEACNYSSVTELIADNVDYLTNNITWKLRDLKHDIAVFDVFCVIISFSQENSLPILLDVVETLLESNSLLHDVYCESFLRVFKLFTVKLRSWFSPIFKADKSSINESNDNYFKFLLGLSELVDRLKNKSDRVLPGTVSKDCDINLNDIFDRRLIASVEMDAADGEPPVENSPDTMDNHLDNDEESQRVDPYIDFIINVANNILHLLPNTNISRKAFILDILADILLILSDKENQLLPLVHKIWSPLVNRLKYDNTNPLIMRRCFQLLCIMAVISGDFIRTRTLKDILPIISGFLSSSAEDSKLKDKHSVYRTSQKYKFQLMLLSELGSLAVHINLQEKELHSILVAATPYLSSKQPLPLQDACVNLFCTIKSNNEDLVWIYLMSVSPPESCLKFQHSEYFDSIKLIESENSKDYRKNTIHLLGMII